MLSCAVASTRAHSRAPLHRLTVAITSLVHGHGYHVASLGQNPVYADTSRSSLIGPVEGNRRHCVRGYFRDIFAHPPHLHHHYGYENHAFPNHLGSAYNDDFPPDLEPTALCSFRNIFMILNATVTLLRGGVREVYEVRSEEKLACAIRAQVT